MGLFSCVAVALTLLSFLALSMSAVNHVHEFHNSVGSNDDTGHLTNCGTNVALSALC